MALEFKPAARKAVPMLISISSVSGGGKTYSGLLLAAGIAGDKGRVGMIDTENGRGEMYADSPGIRAALPNGYDYLQITPPFGPDRYMSAITAAEKAGLTVCVVDSTSHEWEGIGGCCEIAENNKLRGMPNWAMAKREHKRFLNHCLSTNMHLIFCLRAREKVKIMKIDGKDAVVPQGLQPICEKNFIYEMLLSLRLEEETHHAVVLKAPEPLRSLFSSGHLITKADGERIREWNQTGGALDPNEQLFKRARAAAEIGTTSYVAFYGSLSTVQKQTLRNTIHEEMKALADRVDKEPIESDAAEPAEMTA